MPGDMSLGRLQASLAQATQEFTVAAANINFDFTLVKVEAPPEYQDIATVLSSPRVREAEIGPLHATARRLGALFEGFCPRTPNLIKAYGLRASEISREVAEAELQNAKQTRDDNWLRMEYGGIDATSIWAAATSSKEALPVHLLACIIARMFPPADATSIWVEIVNDRKREVLTGVEQGDILHIGILSAIQQEITREQLAKWDSSTRAWLQSADSVRQRQYKQFLLIAQNINVAVHSRGQNLYSNTIHVWKTALSAMEGLISGRPHVFRDAPVLLGLSAWHIFPDMIVFNGQSGSTTIPMKDSLVKEGGILSLGFSDSGPHEAQGVYWSLSLAHHTFYGSPILRTRRLDSDGSRLTLDEFILVCMGSLLSAWRTPIQVTGIALKIVETVIAMRSATASATPTPGESMREFSRPFKAYQDGVQQAVLATSLGRRRPNFIPVEATHTQMPFFQLTHLPTLLYLLQNQGHKILLLRRLASRVIGLNDENSIILCFALTRQKKDVVFASACAKPREDQHSETDRSRGPRHYRWIKRPQRNRDEEFQGMTMNQTHITEDIDVFGKEPSFDEYCSSKLERLQRKHPHEKVEYLDNGNFNGDTRPWFHDTLTETVTLNYSDGSYGYLIGQRDDCEMTYHHPKCEHASLYCRGYGNSGDTPQDYSIPELTFEDVLWCFESGLVSSERLGDLLQLEPAFGFLRCLSAIYATYENLAACGATIHSAIVDYPFQPQILDISGTSNPWLDVSNRLRINRHSVMCLIGYFETASNIADGLKEDSRVIGLSGGDSIFISSKLVNDPAANCSDHSFTRILGNTGHPGFSIFTIPSTLRAREVDPEAWRIEPAPFDNTYVDCFKNTSLHLSFTEWRAPVVQIQSMGQRESNVNLIEAVISIRDSGRWVADVDIHATLSAGSAQLLYQRDCTHSNPIPEISSNIMLAIETWDQVLDVPDGSVVVRSSNNWVARLALVSVLCQHSKKLQGQVFVWTHLCPKCVNNASRHAINIC